MLHFIPQLSSSPHALPSPLSPRSANIYGGRHSNYNYMSSSNETPTNQPKKPFTFAAPTSTKPTPFSQRPVKKAPSPKQDELKERRRTQFLDKVRDQRDSRRYESRGEDVMRRDFMQTQRAYEKELESSAPSATLEEDDVEYELPMWSQGSQMQMQADVEAEEFARDEEEEMRALLEYMPEEDQDAEAESLWSDDVDYDALFEEVLGKEVESGMDGVQQMQQPEGEEMDMS